MASSGSRHTTVDDEAEVPLFANENASLSDQSVVTNADTEELDDQNIYGTRALSIISHWLDVLWNGPAIPRQLHVTMFAEKLQTYPDNLHKRLSKTLSRSLVLLLWGSWFVINVVLARHNIFANVCLARGEDKVCLQPVPRLNCAVNEEFWKGPNDACGLNGDLCMPAREGHRLNFRCPSNCEVEGYTYQHWPVGNQTLMRQPVVIGGGGADGIYRGDSFICPAALHAGIISRYTGGCGQLEWVGPRSNFPSSVSADGKFHSFAFDSDFPLNFRFTKPTKGLSDCKDIRGVHIAVNVVYIFVAAYFLTSPKLFLGTLATFGFWTVTLASNPPWESGTPSRNSEFVSNAFARFLPCCLGLVYIYYSAVRPQLHQMPASFSRAVFWGTGFVIGVLENYVFGALPIDRLIISDLKEQSGALVSLVVIVGIVIAIVLGQAYGFWLSGKFKPYFKAYISGLAVVVILSFWPDETLRIHHYILALALLPGTCLRTTPSLFYQGLLTGLYLAGVARWDFDSMLETSTSLNRGDAVSSSSDPTLLKADHSKPYMYAEWEAKPTDEYDGYTIMINDIERAVVPANKTTTRHGFNLTQWIDDFYDDEDDSDVDDDDDLGTTKWYIRVAAAALQSRPVRSGKFSDGVLFDSRKFAR